MDRNLIMQRCHDQLETLLVFQWKLHSLPITELSFTFLSKNDMIYPIVGIGNVAGNMTCSPPLKRLAREGQEGGHITEGDLSSLCNQAVVLIVKICCTPSTHQKCL